MAFGYCLGLIVVWSVFLDFWIWFEFVCVLTVLHGNVWGILVFELGLHIVWS